MNDRPTVLIIECGSKYSHLLAKKIRELGIYSKLVSCEAIDEVSIDENLKTIIFSGGAGSVFDHVSPKIPRPFLNAVMDRNIPIITLAYATYALVQAFGGELIRNDKPAYSRVNVMPKGRSVLFPYAGAAGAGFSAWMLQGDDVRLLPEGFSYAAHSLSGMCAAIENSEKRIFGLLFHPEVLHTEGGREILRHLVLETCQVQPTWNIDSILEQRIRNVVETVGSEHVVCSLSGGVDSTVAAALLANAIGKKLHCIFVDTGLLRYQEADRTLASYQTRMGLTVDTVEASSIFLERLRVVADPDSKRKIVEETFNEIFNKELKVLAQRLGKKPKYLVRGTLYSDKLENPQYELKRKRDRKKTANGRFKSSMEGSICGDGNALTLLEPFNDLFKEEVRDLGRKLGVPPQMLKRHPFPLSGLAGRIVGVVTRDRLDTLRKVDEIYIDSLRDAGLYDQLWQAFAVSIPLLPSFDLMANTQTESEEVIALRAVSSSDGINAEWYPFDPRFLARVASRITNEVKNVSRVVYDISSKPPTPIEWG